MANAKGSLLIGLVRALRRQRAEATAVLAPELQHYLDDWISPSEWYPEVDLAGLQRAAISLLGMPLEEGYRAMGRIGAEVGATLYYKTFVTEGLSLSAIAGRTFAMWSSMHDTGQMNFRLTSSHGGDLDLIGFEQSTRELCSSIGAYVQRSLEIAKLRTVRVDKVECRVDGAPICRWRCSWE